MGSDSTRFGIAWVSNSPQKAVLQASDTLLGPGKANSNDVMSLFRASSTQLTKTLQFLDVLRDLRPLFRGGIRRDTNSFQLVNVLRVYRRRGPALN